jgi:hypothetical protein
VVTVGEERVLSFSVLTGRTTKTTSTSSTTTDGADGDTGHELNNHFFIWVYCSDLADSILRFTGSSFYLEGVSNCMKTVHGTESFLRSL